jgi:SacI homology domain
VAKIHEVGFYSLNTSTWDDYASANDGPVTPDAIDASFRDTYISQPANGVPYEHPCLPLGKILSSGTFYYATDSPWDLSTRLAVRLSRKSRDPNALHDSGQFDERFVWNEYIIRSLLDFRARLSEHERDDLDRCGFLVGFYVCGLALRLIATTFSLDSGDPGLCWAIHHGLTRSSDERPTRGCNTRVNIKTGMETRRDKVQYAGYRRRWEYRQLCGGECADLGFYGLRLRSFHRQKPSSAQTNIA